jgi:hypothetical protein
MTAKRVDTEQSRSASPGVNDKFLEVAQSSMYPKAQLFALVANSKICQGGQKLRFV